MAPIIEQHGPLPDVIHKDTPQSLVQTGFVKNLEMSEESESLAKYGKISEDFSQKYHTYDRKRSSASKNNLASWIGKLNTQLHEGIDFNRFSEDERVPIVLNDAGDVPFLFFFPETRVVDNPADQGSRYLQLETVLITPSSIKRITLSLEHFELPVTLEQYLQGMQDLHKFVTGEEEVSTRIAVEDITLDTNVNMILLEKLGKLAQTTTTEKDVEKALDQTDSDN